MTGLVHSLPSTAPKETPSRLVPGARDAGRIDRAGRTPSVNGAETTPYEVAMTENRETDGQDACRPPRRLANLSNDPLGDLIARPGCEVLLQAGRRQPEWLRVDVDARKFQPS
jgi:hypothetical protein